MKRILAIALFSGLASMHVNARIGETQEEITARYGVGHLAPSRLQGVQCMNYEKDGLSIDVTMLNGKCVWEMYHTAVFTPQLIQKLLKANNVKPAPTGTPDPHDFTKGWATVNSTSVVNSGWHENKAEQRWERPGTPRLWAYLEPGHPDYFTVMDIDAINAYKAKQSANYTKPGF